MTNHLTDRLAAIRERAEAVGAIPYWADAHSAGETVASSQGDVSSLLEAVEAVVKALRIIQNTYHSGPPCEIQEAKMSQARYVAKLLENIIGEHLGGGE